MIDEIFFVSLGTLLGLFLAKKRVVDWDNVEGAYGKAKSLVKKNKPTDPEIIKE